MFVFPGFNSNIEHRNKTFHIQTEVNDAQGTNKINTLVYFSGRIFFSRSTELQQEDLANRETASIAIRRQHNRVIRDLISDQLKPQENQVTNNDEIDFEGFYGNDKIYSCYERCFDSALKTYKKLLLTEEDSELP